MSLLDVVRGATFDDFLFNPQYSVIERRDPSAIELTCRFSTGLTLKRPIVSANMDTVTRSEMAIAVAEEGGIGIIDRGFRSGEIEPQVREVEIVKRKQHGIIADPYTVAADASLADAAARMRATGVGTLVVVDGGGRLQGLLTTRDLRFVDRSQGTVASRMTPRDRLIVQRGTPDLGAAEEVMRAQKIKKLPLVGSDGTLLGLITAKDLIKHTQHPFATRDEKDGKAPTSVSLFDQGLIQVLQASVTGLEPKQKYVLALADRVDGSGSLQPLAAFMTNPAGSAIVNATGPIRQIVNDPATSERRYLVIAPGDPTKFGEAVQVQTQ